MAKATNFNPKSLENLSPIHTRTTPEQRRENARKGGLASAAKSKEQRLLRDIIREFGAKKVPKRKLSAIAEKYDVDPEVMEGLTNDALMIVAQYMEAAAGNVDAARFLRDTSGQSPAQMVRVGALDVQSADLSQVPDDVLQAEIAALEAGDE